MTRNGTREFVSLIPETPFADAGRRIDPPVSDPSAMLVDRGRDRRTRTGRGSAGNVRRIPWM